MSSLTADPLKTTMVTADPSQKVATQASGQDQERVQQTVTDGTGQNHSLPLAKEHQSQQHHQTLKS
jgi:hypothetical protein